MYQMLIDLLYRNKIEYTVIIQDEEIFIKMDSKNIIISNDEDYVILYFPNGDIFKISKKLIKDYTNESITLNRNVQYNIEVRLR